MILLNNINLPLKTDFSSLKPIVAKELKTDIQYIKSASLYKKSVDARQRDKVHFCCSFLVEASGEDRLIARSKKAQRYNERKYTFKKVDFCPEHRPVIVGFGPAGMFAALTLAIAGLKPIVLERGADADTRKNDVESFLAGGKLNENSNVQFGEGGAGTFSDGKLNTGIKDIRCRTVLEKLYEFGAPKHILTDAKPHIGTDILIDVVKNLRCKVEELGGEVRFNCKLDRIITPNGKVTAVIANGEEIKCDNIILACGHSARDTFAMLKEIGIEIERKPFAMGVRIEHLQSDIDRALYGKYAGHPALSAADYKLAVHLKNGRGVYTFCMCPGGEVINASSEENMLAINGMSNSRRDGQNANSALLVNVDPTDFEGDDVLAGCELQRKIEQKAYNIASGAVPTVTLGEFLYGRPDTTEKVKPTVKPNTVNADFYDIFPRFIVDSLKEGIPLFDKKLPGFADSAAILSAPETRSSSPIRILRNENGQSVNTEGLFPCGEGAGYAGGIMSAAVDGIRTAEALIDAIKQD